MLTEQFAIETSLTHPVVLGIDEFVFNIFVNKSWEGRDSAEMYFTTYRLDTGRLFQSYYGLIKRLNKYLTNHVAAIHCIVNLFC